MSAAGWVAWVVAAISFVGYACALAVGPTCADTFAAPAAVAFFGSFIWIAFCSDRKGKR